MFTLFTDIYCVLTSRSYKAWLLYFIYTYVLLNFEEYVYIVYILNFSFIKLSIVSRKLICEIMV